MPAYLRGQKRPEIRFVQAHSGPLLYGFKPKDYGPITGVSTADVAALGWKKPDELAAGAITVLGANAPKPQRMRKTLVNNPGAGVQGSASTFCSYPSIQAAMAAKWEPVGSTRGVTITNNGRTTTVGATIDASGALYLFPMNASDAATYAAELGLQLPANISNVERGKAFSGTSRPKPARVGKVVSNSTGATFSSYCSYDKLGDALAAGYQLIQSEVLPPIPYSAPPATP